MRRPRILHLEDDDDFRVLFGRAVRQAGLDVELVRVDSAAGFGAALEAGGIDLVLADGSVRGYGGLAALRDLRVRDLEVPFIVLTGCAPAEGAGAYMAAGADECLLKDDLPLAVARLRPYLLVGRAARSHETSPFADTAFWLAWAVKRLCREGSTVAISSVVPQAARRLVRSDVATIAFRDGNACRYVGEEGLDSRFSPAVLPIQDSISGRSMLEDRAVLVRDIATQGGGTPLLGENGSMRSGLAVPVGRGFPVAAIAVYRSKPHEPSALELELLGALADVTALALDRSGMVTGRHRIEPVAAEWQPTSAELHALTRRISHDLRNSLGQVRGFAEFLESDHAAGLDENGRSIVDHLLKATTRLWRGVDGLIDLTEIWGAPFSPRVLDLSAAGRDVATTLLVTQPGRVVEWRLDEGLRAYADPALLRILLERLFSNALTCTATRTLGLIEMGTAAVGADQITFFIRDNGVGFDSLVHPAEEAMGTMSEYLIIQRIVHMHGGKVWAEGALDAGATFFFSLPAVP